MYLNGWVVLQKGIKVSVFQETFVKFEIPPSIITISPLAPALENCRTICSPIKSPEFFLSVVIWSWGSVKTNNYEPTQDTPAAPTPLDKLFHPLTLSLAEAFEKSFRKSSIFQHHNHLHLSSFNLQP